MGAALPVASAASRSLAEQRLQPGILMRLQPSAGTKCRGALRSVHSEAPAKRTAFRGSFECSPVLRTARCCLLESEGENSEKKNLANPAGFQHLWILKAYVWGKVDVLVALGRGDCSLIPSLVVVGHRLSPPALETGRFRNLNNHSFIHF